MTIEYHNVPLRDRAGDRRAVCCHFCKAEFPDTVEAAIAAGWWPDYYIGDVQHDGPVCEKCAAEKCEIATDGELELRAEK